MKKKIILAVIAGAFLTAPLLTYKLKPQFLAAFLESRRDNSKIIHSVSNNKFHSSGFFELKKTIIENLKSVGLKNKEEDYQTQIGITSHHLPTAFPFISNFYRQLYNSQGPRETFVIVGPDHFERCQAPVTTSKMPYLTPFGELAVDEQIADKILQAGAFIDDNCFDNEHSVAVQTIFVKYLFPDAKIVPLLFSANASNRSINQIAEALSVYKDKIAVIGSVDFSHYQKRDRAIKIDAESEQMIKNLDASFLDIEHADSPPTVKFAILLAKKIGATTPKILERANSFDFTGNPESTTGYINIIFVGNKKSDNSVTLMFMGDLMFDRAIRQSAKKNGNNFIFEKVSDLLADNDLVVANLEGPLTTSKSISFGTLPGSDANYIFTFDPSLAKTLFERNIRLVNLGNNHILNFGQKGLDSTRKYLREAGVEYFGDPNGQRSLIKEIKDIKISFVSYNQFVDNLKKEQVAVIQEIKKVKVQSEIVILYTHWGNEYALIPADAIKNLAHQFIDAGADLIIGSHPHVIQPLEDYAGKKIYYSLGNFIFDQYFNSEVRQGLGVILRINRETKRIDFEEKKFYLETNGQTAKTE